MNVLLVVAMALTVCVYSACADGSFGSSEHGGFGPTGSGCACGTGNRNPCQSNSGTTLLGCRGSNKYVQCVDATCTPQTCPTSQVWNSTLNACAACQSGYQLSTNSQTCVCVTGTTPTGRNTCGPCPSDATVDPDSCYCTAPLTLNKAANACQACPATATLRGDDCECSATLFWNEAAWACQPCPGTLVTSGTGRRVQTRCTCTGTNQIFDRKTVACVTCPDGTTADSDGDSCDCPIRGQFYNTTTLVCQCPRGTALNSAGTGCQWVPRTTTVAPAAGRRRR